MCRCQYYRHDIVDNVAISEDSIISIIGIVLKYECATIYSLRLKYLY